MKKNSLLVVRVIMYAIPLQPLDVNDRNFPTAVWDLALSSLPLLYHVCLPLHLQNVASFLYSTVLLQHSSTAEVEEVEEGVGGGGKGEGVGEGGRGCKEEKTEREVAVTFLNSERFQDMRKLQEVLLSTGFERTALSLPKRFGATQTYTHMQVG